MNGDTLLPVFWEKRLQAIENKGREGGKDGKETHKRRQATASKRVGTSDGVHPRGIWMDVKIKGLREKRFVRL